MFSSARYFATVRLAIGIPRSERISTISLSLNGFRASSLRTKSEMASFTLVLLRAAPAVVWYPGVKKYFISNTPCGVAMYFPEIARLTVVSWTPTASAICTIVIGLRNALSRSEEHTSELQSHLNLLCRLLLEKKKLCIRPLRLRTLA